MTVKEKHFRRGDGITLVIKYYFLLNHSFFGGEESLAFRKFRKCGSTIRMDAFDKSELCGCSFKVGLLPFCIVFIFGEICSPSLCPFSWSRCVWECRVERLPVLTCSVLMLFSSCKWMKRSPHGPALCVTNLLLLSCSPLMGKLWVLLMAFPTVQANTLD